MQYRKKLKFKQTHNSFHYIYSTMQAQHHICNHSDPYMWTLNSIYIFDAKINSKVMDDSNESVSPLY